MSSRRPASFLRAHLPWLVLIIPLLLASKGQGCKSPCKPDIEEEEVEVEDADIQPIAVSLQIVSIDPSEHEVGDRFEAMIYGSGFAYGTGARVGDDTLNSVDVRDENTLSVVIPSLPEGVYDVTVYDADGHKSVLRRGLILTSSTEDCRFAQIHFAFDEAGLTAAAREILDKNVDCYRAATARIRIEGHADERGTTEYNLALGQRRAQTTKRYLTGQGIGPSRQQVMSYGEERSMNDNHTEAAWAENRRAEVFLGD